MSEGVMQMEVSVGQVVEIGDDVSSAMDVDHSDTRDGKRQEVRCRSVKSGKKTDMNERTRYAEAIWEEMGKEGMTKDQVAMLLGEMDMMDESGESVGGEYVGGLPIGRHSEWIGSG